MENFFKTILNSKPIQIIIAVASLVGGIFLILWVMCKQSFSFNTFKQKEYNKKVKKAEKENNKLNNETEEVQNDSIQTSNKIKNNINKRKDKFKDLNK